MWFSNCYYLLINNAVLVEGVDIYNLRQSLVHAITSRSGIASQSLSALADIVRFNEDLPEIGLPIVQRIKLRMENIGRVVFKTTIYVFQKLGGSHRIFDCFLNTF